MKKLAALTAAEAAFWLLILAGAFRALVWWLS